MLAYCLALDVKFPVRGLLCQQRFRKLWSVADSILGNFVIKLASEGLLKDWGSRPLSTEDSLGKAFSFVAQSSYGQQLSEDFLA